LAAWILNTARTRMGLPSATLAFISPPLYVYL
jgi:hypothetical protein